MVHMRVQKMLQEHIPHVGQLKRRLFGREKDGPYYKRKEAFGEKRYLEIMPKLGKIRNEVGKELNNLLTEVKQIEKDGAFPEKEREEVLTKLENMLKAVKLIEDVIDREEEQHKLGLDKTGIEKLRNDVQENINKIKGIEEETPVVYVPKKRVNGTERAPPEKLAEPEKPKESETQKPKEREEIDLNKIRLLQEQWGKKLSEESEKMVTEILTLIRRQRRTAELSGGKVTLREIIGVIEAKFKQQKRIFERAALVGMTEAEKKMMMRVFNDTIARDARQLVKDYEAGIKKEVEKNKP